jgi:catechol 2,3-dioxygenase-like lactoylglutathione lyase family enzyme
MNDSQPKILSMVTLGVSDLKRATIFYRDGLGWPADEKHEGVVFFRARGAWLALFPIEDLAADAQISGEGHGFGRTALAHNVASRDAVLGVLQIAQNAGATITKPAQDTSWGGFAGYFRDPDGHLWEVAWNPHLDLT